jgi:protein SERAC1
LRLLTSTPNSIVFVAGFGGHPIKTWLYDPNADSPRSPRSPRSLKTPKSPKVAPVGNVLRKNPSLNPIHKSTSKLQLDFLEESPREPISSDQTVYWPLDLLPTSCPTARILTWGCNTIVSNGQLPRNQNDIFAHADDLLQELTVARDETKTIGRPIIFVTHSLGGVIIKEVC